MGDWEADGEAGGEGWGGGEDKVCQVTVAVGVSAG